MPKILALVLVISLAVGFATGGRLRGLSRITFRHLPLLYLALVLGIIPLIVSIGQGRARLLVVAGYLVLAAFLILNIRQPTLELRLGVMILCLGWVLNATPFIANGGMPLSLFAYRKAGITDTLTPAKGGFFKIVVAHRGTHLRYLGDAIPVRALQQVVSVGDIVLSLGVAWLIVGGMHAKERRVERPTA